MAIKGYEVRFIFTILFICIFAEANGQHRLPPLDFEQFRKDVAAAQSPEEKLKQYVDIALQVFRYRPDSLFTFAKEVQKLQGLEPAKRKAFKHFFLAYAWRPINRDSAIYYAAQAAEQLKKLDEKESYLRTEVLLGIEYSRKSDYLKAEEAFLDGLFFSQSLDSVYYPIHFFYGNLGMLYSKVGADNLAVNMFEKLLEQVDNANDRCNVISRLAGNMMQLNELDKAVQMLLPCLNANLVPPLQAAIRAGLSEIVGKMGEKDRSLALMERATSISIRYKLPRQQIGHLVRLGNQYLDMNRVHQADSVRVIIEDTNFHRKQRDLRIKKVLFLSSLALTHGNYKKTIAYADSAIRIAGASGNLQRLLGKVYATRARAYEKLGKMDLAVENLRLQDKLEEVQFEQERIRSEAMMKVRYQLQNKEDELALVSTRLNIMSTRSALLLGLAIVIGLACGFIYSRYRKSRSNEEMQATELYERDITIAELEQKVVEQNRKLKERNIPEWIALNSQVKLSLDEIRYIRSEGNYVKIFLSDVNRAPMMERLTLKQCEEMLPDEITMRIHRSTIVNIRHVSHISDEVLFLKDSTRLKISRRYRKDLVNFLG